jgi:hypothetical protein
VRPGRKAVGAGLLLLAAHSARAEQPAGPRRDIEALGAMLERAVERVSHSDAVLLPGAQECRGYRIQGVGVMFVIPPRALRPAGRLLLFQRRSEGRTPAARSQGRAVDPEAEQQIALVEAQADELTREAARARQEAERAMEQISRQIRIRLAAQAASTSAAAPASAPAPPTAPRAPEAPTPPAPREAPLPPAPPWSYWFETPQPDGEDRAPEAVVADVKEALTAVIESHGSSLSVLRPEELLIAAVDFVDGMTFAGRASPERTLVIRVKKKDLDERRGGRLSSEELRRRVEYLEY